MLVLLTSVHASDKFSITMIDDLCSQIVTSLNASANQCVSRTAGNFFKHWWTDTLSALKADSVQAHRLWHEHGCPKHGPIYDAKRCAKAKYKQALRTADRHEIITFSNDLHEYLNKRIKLLFGTPGMRNLAKQFKLSCSCWLCQ